MWILMVTLLWMRFIIRMVPTMQSRELLVQMEEFLVRWHTPSEEEIPLQSISLETKISISSNLEYPILSNLQIRFLVKYSIYQQNNHMVDLLQLCDYFVNNFAMN